MDIKIPSDLPATKPAVSQIGGLLAQLKAAGTIEAEVLRLLPGNQLLLSSRLGDILTSNSLNYQAGDRLNLRLDDSTQQPVLKVSPRLAKPLLLDSRQNPELARALPPDRPALARVIRIVAQQAEIRLADQTLKLPRQLNLARNQLLSLRRSDLRQTIEITPIERKAIYKAILKQLVPRQAESRTSSLVGLLKLMAPGAVRPEPESIRQPEPGRSQSPLRPLPAAAARDRPAAQAKAAPVLIQAQAKRDPVGTQTTASNPPGKSGSPVGPEMTARPMAAIGPAKPLPNAPRGRPAINEVDPTPAARATNPGTGQTGKFSTRKLAVPQLAASPGRPSPASLQSNGIAPTSHTTVIPNTSPQTGDGRAIPVNQAQRHATVAVQGMQAAVEPAMPQGPAAASHAGQPVSNNGALTAALQPLLQLVTRFPDIDAGQIKKWLEFARLIYPPKPGVSSTARPDIFKVLQPFSEAESLSRSPQQNPGAAATTDSPTTRAQIQEALISQAREGVRLIEQSLSQNLLQRATLGLQQETQQPLSLGFAVPYVDDQQTKPLYIDLTQRNQAQEESDKSWDIRLSFDLAGLGPVACHLVLAGNTIGASFYSEQAQTRERIETELPMLRQQLSQAGFTTGELHSFRGQAQPNRAPTAADFAEALVDIEV